MAIVNYENAGFNVCIIPIQYFTQNYYYSFDDPGITFGDNLLDFRIEGVENEVFNYSGIRLTVQYSSGTTGIQIYLYNENTIVFSTNDGNPYLTYGLALGIDDSQHLGYISIVRTISGTRYGIFTAYEYGDLSYYNWIKGIPVPIIYQWQSVPSISGKNGILSLSQAKASALNNGEPVSSASASDFDSLTAQVSTLVTDDSQMAGKEAGGISGSGDNSADQSTGNAFGQGESGTNVSGGGSGLYGGYKGTLSKSGGAGSGYIGNSLLSNKKMVGYNVPTSSAEGTKTESVNEASATPVSGKPKSGNGFVKIKFLREAGISLIIKSNNSYILNPALVKSGTDINSNIQVTSDGGYTAINNNLSKYIGSNKTLHSTQKSLSDLQFLYQKYDDIVGRHCQNSTYMRTQVFIPINRIQNPKGITYKHSSYANYGDFNFGFIACYYINPNDGKIYEAGIKTVNSTNIDDWASDILNLNTEYIDYVSFQWNDAEHDFKDIKIIY